MRALEINNGRVIDFEGSRKNGIQQAAIIDFHKFEIVSYKEFKCTDGSFTEWLIKVTKNTKIDFWVAHNANVEKIFIKKFAPYRFESSLNWPNINWGPWIDTLKLYKRLYPQHKDFKLQNLARVFLEPEELNILAQSICKRNEMRFHQAMYDCLATFMLIKRVSDKVNLRLFLD